MNIEERTPNMSNIDPRESQSKNISENMSTYQEITINQYDNNNQIQIDNVKQMTNNNSTKMIIGNRNNSE